MEFETKQTFPSCYGKHINIPLLHQVVYLVYETAEEVTPEDRGFFENSALYSGENYNSIKKEYGLSYLGEVLERYAEKIGSGKEIIRAIVLALAYTASIQDNKMFVGAQLPQFMAAVRRELKGDIYLDGAMYLIHRAQGKKESDTLAERLLRNCYQQTEELAFVLSILPEETAYPILKEQILRLFGKEKTISCLESPNLFYWIGRYMKNRGDKKRDAAFLNGLSKMNSMIVKEDSTCYQNLVANGYTEDEIIFQNFVLLIFFTKEEIGDLTKEKAALRFVKRFSEKKESFEKWIENLIETVLIDYREFPVKCDGSKTILNWLMQNVTIQSPEMFLLFYKKFEKKFVMKFPIMETRWDILAQKLDEESYRYVFGWQIAGGMNQTKETLLQWLEKYRALTNEDFIAIVAENERYRSDSDCFHIFVEKGIFHLPEMFQKYYHDGQMTDTGKKVIENILKYSDSIPDRQAFELWKYLFETYPQKEIILLWIKMASPHHELYYSSKVYPYKAIFKLDKSFLSKEEQAQVFQWLSAIIFYAQPYGYADFWLDALKTDSVHEYAPQTMWSEVFSVFYQSEKYKDKVRYMREKFLSEDELLKLQQFESEEKARLKQEKLKKLQQELETEFKQELDGTMKSIWKVVDSNKYRIERFEQVVIGIIPELEKLLTEKNWLLSINELSDFMRLGGLILQECPATQEIVEMLMKVKLKRENVLDEETNV